MKRSIIYITVLCMLLSFCGCKKTADNGSSQKCEVALITDSGTIQDSGYNEKAYNGMVKYCNENNIEYASFMPSDASTESYLNEIKSAVKSGAKVIICPSNLQEEAVFEAQDDYNQVNFILINGEPHSSDYSDFTIKENTVAIEFSEEELGFLAGYAAVREGYRYIGFMGGMPEDSVIRYGYGFVQGADYAAIEVGAKIYIAYVYANTFTEDVHVKNMASNWYQNGMEAIFTCGGSMNKSVIAAAEENMKSVFVADSDTKSSSAEIVFSCVNNITDSVYNEVSNYYNGSFEGGKIKRLSLKENGIYIDMSDSKFNNFSDVEYEAICNILKNKEIVPYNNTEIGTTKELNLVNTQIVYAEYE